MVTEYLPSTLFPYALTVIKSVECECDMPTVGWLLGEINADLGK